MERVTITIATTIAIAVAGCVHRSPIDDGARRRARAAALCEGLDATAMDRTLADDPGRVLGAEPITEFGGRPRRLRTVGVRMRVQGAPRASSVSIEQLLSCQAARYAAGLVPGDRDPLAVAGIELRARPTGYGFELVLRAGDDRAAAEAARRARILADAQ